MGVIPDEAEVREVRRRNEPVLLSLPGVVGVGIGEMRDKRGRAVTCIRVYVEHLDERLKQQIPSELEGVPTEVKEIGTVRLL